jgi:hypothetical protein
VANNPKERLFEPTKIEWLLAGGLEGMDAGERQMLLVMAETKLQDGYKPNAQEKKVVNKLRELAGDEYDVQDIQRKVKEMVTTPKKADQSGIILPATLNKLLKRVRTRKSGGSDDKN